MPILQVQQLSKRFGKIAALDDVSFAVQPGEVLGLIGPNGAGKSTLFDCLAGLLPHDGGRVLGPQLRPAVPADLLFYVPDGIVPWPEQPLRWVLDFGVGFFGGVAGQRDEVVAELDLTNFLDQPLGALSKGQRKRGLLALGLLAPQPLLLIDEPLDGLDLRQMRDVAGVLRKHAAAGRTLFLSIHQIGDAARFCDRFVLLSGGQVRGEGTIAELAAVARARHPERAFTDLEEVFLALT
ncbi:MAG: ABC transporter ATP-binding protein [Acidobacteria bacterium]|nr:ABC transporter ATP-binding protein [Acidobacteriota bacterium]